MSHATATKTAAKKPAKKKVSAFSTRKVDPAYYWMAVPAAIIFAFFLYLPFLDGVKYSFTNSQGYGDYKFIGLKNYIALFQDNRVGHAYLFTFLIAILITVLINVIALFLSVLLNSKIAFKNGFRAIFFIPYTASGFSACGKLFSNMFGIDYMTAMIISAVVIVLYCALGGFLAASTTDLIQSIIMTVALFVVLGLGEGFIGGFDKVFANIRSLDGFTDLFRGFDVAKGTASSYGAISVVSTLAWGLGYFGMPHILLRFMAISDPDELKKSRRIASVWVVISMAIAILIGVVGYSLMNAGIVGPYASNSEAETIIVDISRYISGFGFIPSFVAGIFISGILASTMSTADSQLIAASSSITQDILVDTMHVRLSERAKMILARVTVVVISIIGIFLARDPSSSVFRIVSFAWAGFGAAFGPVILCALFWRRTTKWGALAGMIGGGATVFIWKFIIREAFKGTVLDIYELLPAFIVAILLTVIVSLATKAPDKEVTETFDAVRTTK